MTNGNERAFGNTIFDQEGKAVGMLGGLTIREYFAAMTMQGYTAQTQAFYLDDVGQKAIVILAVRMADALIEALNK